MGAGPGDPGLITLRGIECLRRADVVLYDYLANSQLLEHASPQAEHTCLGRHGRDPLLSQAEINDRLVSAARDGKTVVRLKAGDPMIFGRASDEIQALIQAGIEFEIVPGVSSAIAISAYTGIPLTDRDLASAVAFVTGQEQRAKSESALDYSQLAQFPGTLVVYMGVTTAPVWTAALIAGGRAAETPAAIVRRCTWPDQQIVHCQLGTVSRVVAEQHIRPPALVIVGEVAAAHMAINWFTTRPLSQRTVLITRAADQQAELRTQFAELGANVLVQSAITIGPPRDWQPVDHALAQIEHYDWLVFSSSNGVRYFFDRLQAGTHDLRALGHARLAVIGPGTRDALASYHLKADLQPTDYRAEALAEALLPQAANRRFLLLRASRGREILAEELQRAGAQVDQVVVYQSTDVEVPDPDVRAALESGEVDYVTVTSSAIARSLAKLFGEALRRTRLASISPITTATLQELGYTPALEATSYTPAGVVAAILEQCAKQNG